MVAKKAKNDKTGQNQRFFQRFFFSTAVYIGAEEAFKKIIGSIIQNWMIIKNNERATL